MPGGVIFRDELDDLAVLPDQIMRAGLGRGIGEGVDRALGGRRVGDVNDDPLDPLAAATGGEGG